MRASTSLQYDCICPSKKCRKCGDIKSIIYYYIRDNKVNTTCIDCISLRSKLYYIKNREEKVNKQRYYNECKRNPNVIRKRIERKPKPIVSFSLQHDCICPSKKCRKCNEIKSLVDFSVRKESIAPYCYECNRKIDLFRSKSPLYKENKRRWGRSEKRKANRKKYRERERIYNKEYRKRNIDLFRKKEREYAKKRKAEDHNYKMATKLRTSVHRILAGRRKTGSTTELLGMPLIDCIKYLESKFDKHMTWENYGTYWHIDHIIPCAAFDLSDPIQQKQCFHYTNLQPLEAKANMSKGDKILNPVQMKIAI